MTFPAAAQIQQAWVARYNNGIANGTNQAVKIALDNTGNIYVTGFSQNSLSNLGYVTLKYAPTGKQLWASRYDATNYPTATPSGLVLDSSNNVVATGNALTIKYDTNGSQLWTAPYDGAAIAMDSGGNAIVTGFGSGFNTVKISPSGTNLWSASYNQPLGPVSSQAVVVDGGSNVYVAGENTYICNYEGGQNVGCYVDLLIVKYDQDGNQLWTAENLRGSDYSVEVAGLALYNASDIYVAPNTYTGPTSPDQTFSTYSYTTDGRVAWSAFNPTDDVYSISHALAVDGAGNTFVIGQNANHYPNMQYGTYKINADGSYIWTNLYPSSPTGMSVGTAIALDQADNVYVTGYSPGTNSINDIVTIKYDANGNQIWLQRYSSPGNGNAAGNAIAVDNNGNVYVTGYDTTTAGGTEIVTIKYSPVTLQRRSDGTVILQAQGTPGESFDIEASEDLLHWLDLGSVLADTNGLMQFDDTNAPAYPARFYYTTPQ
jgi:hypothetical protein